MSERVTFARSMLLAEGAGYRGYQYSVDMLKMMHPDLSGVVKHESKHIKQGKLKNEGKTMG